MCRGMEPWVFIKAAWVFSVIEEFSFYDNPQLHAFNWFATISIEGMPHGTYGGVCGLHSILLFP